MGFIWVYFHLTEMVIESLTIVLLLRSVPARPAILNQACSWFSWKVMSHLLTVSYGNAELPEQSEEGTQSIYNSFYGNSLSELLPLVALSAHTWVDSAKRGVNLCYLTSGDR